MSKFHVVCFGIIALLQSACSAYPVAPAIMPVRQPILQTIPAPDFRTSSGLLGEEVELSGIYTNSPAGATLLLRSGEKIAILAPAGRNLNALPGIENRSYIRLRGRLISRPNQLGLELVQVFR